MKIYQPVILLFLFLFYGQISFADHIFGGNMSFTQINKATGKFKITMNIYVDVRSLDSPTIASFKNDKHNVRIFSKNGNSKILDVQLDYEKSDDLIYDNEICAKLKGLKTTEYTYSQEIILNTNDYVNSDGYYVAWARCCRNGGIDNISSPEFAGLTLYLEFPALKKNGQNIAYSSPTFSLPNGDYICINKPFEMSMSAVNLEKGDDLKYSIVTPFGSHNTLTYYSKTVEAGPYPFVQWNNGYSLSSSIKGNPALSIDQKTGVISVTTNIIGLFVFAIQCEQFRDGQRIGLIRQDFQLPVVDCSGITPVFSSILFNSNPVTEIGICPGEAVNLEISSTTGNFNYQWKKDGINIVGAKSATHQATEFGNYTVIKSFKTTCSNDTISQKVRIKEAILLKVDSSPKQICKGDSISLEAIALRNNINFTWTYNGKIKGIKPIIFAKEIGTYVVEGKLAGLNCNSKDSLKVTRKDSPKISIANRNIALSSGDSKTLTINSTDVQSDFKWVPSKWLDNPLVASPITTPQDDIIYNILVSTPDMCPVKDSITITIIRKIYIPNAFSPNGDGTNDKWEIFGINQFLNNEVYVYNRWGELVFYAKSYRNDWDGKYRDTVVPPGEYSYEIRNASTINEFKFLGHLSILY